jgi:cytochrome c
MTTLAARITLVIAPLIPILLSGTSAMAGNVERGRHLALVHCARCHSIDKSTASPFPAAPPFRTLHTRYPVEDLEEPLAEGIATGHPSMPEFRFEPDQIADFIAFLKSLQ